ncbi:uncharacterized protein LOC110817003 isoform X2 [Carica papaya]|uniref:uncharacterized protein LOC110817003 isoform X2 n=1 Tax=Carica papaya TaxID=3649 RepID=UPI000B8CF832|nr:uncharacterized protein LOC110817003 isoform X2 [Carica papaya]
MDSIISSALEEICSHGNAGLSISSLWFKLSADFPLSPSLKASIWKNLLLVPTLQFEARNARYNNADSSVQCLEDAEKLGLRIIANEQLRDNFVGLYDAPSNFSAVQRRALERLAIARSNGITQNQLAKEFGIEGKNLFYIVRNLECRGLIVRQPALVRKKEHCIEGESKTSSCVTTNMMCLYRYAKHLGSQQRFEINKEDYTLDGIEKESEKNGDGFALERVKEDVLIKDYLPAMLAVCDKLEEANGQVLVVSDIKQDLGYTGSRSGHKAWRSICRRLKDAQIVEEFDAVVNEKVERCLRLLKKFSPKDFELTAIGSGDNLDTEKQLKFGRTFRRTEQLVELPIEHQIHDMVDAEGSEGLAVMEVCERLGIDKKRNYSRLCSMFSRFGMHLQAESHRKTTAFRVWTSGNSNPELSNAFHNKSQDVNVENNSPNIDMDYLDVVEGPTSVFVNHDYSTSGCHLSAPGKVNDGELDVENSHSSNQDGKTECLPSQNLQESLHEANETDPDADLDVMKSVMENVAPTETKSPAILKPPNSRAHHPYLLTADNARREQRILQWLQDEKFILRIELYRRLLSLEKDKSTKMDRKTIDRILSKLQEQGLCRRMVINVPVVTNCGRNRGTLVVLHPSVQSLTPEILGEIHDRLRSVEIQSHGQASTRWKNNESVPVLNDVQRTQNHVGSDFRATRSEAMRANGFVLAKMVRAKLLHGFLWDYLSATPGWDNALSSRNHHRSYQLFSLEAAVKAIPLELFLQVAGSTQTFDDMIEKCKKGLRLSDLPAEEYKLLMDTLATGRLSLVIDMLRRLKLYNVVDSASK